MRERVPFSHYLARMAAVGFHPSTVRGQNFLLDPSLHRWIAERSGAGRSDTVVEIGVGLGFLTRELAHRAGRVLGIEIDERLFEIARQDLRGAANVQLLCTDALAGPGRSLVPEIGRAIARAQSDGGRGLLVANLPYSVSGPLLAETVALPCLPDGAIVLVQKELALRVAAEPGSRDYGGLSVLVQALFTARSLRDVKPDAFRPRPKVTSTALQLEVRRDAPMVLAEPAARRQFAAFVRVLFQQRRKVLRTTLANAVKAIEGVTPELDASVLASRAERHAPGQIVEWWARASGRA